MEGDLKVGGLKVKMAVVSFWLTNTPEGEGRLSLYPVGAGIYMTPRDIVSLFESHEYVRKAEFKGWM